MRASTPRSREGAAMLLMIDNYDSFTYNLVQYFGQLQQDVRVVRNDQITVAEIERLRLAQRTEHHRLRKRDVRNGDLQDRDLSQEDRWRVVRAVARQPRPRRTLVV